MDSIHDYFDKTRSALQKLYQAVGSYYVLLQEPNRPVFVHWGEYTDDVRRKHEIWTEQNKPILQERAKRDNDFVSETFAMATLNGAILQFAYMAIELYSKNTKSYEKFIDLIPDNHKTARFCIGRIIDEVPLGLIVYAGRNQAHHYDDKSYGKITERVFHQLANWYSPTFKKDFLNNHYDLSNPNVVNFATNILWKLNWQNYDVYEKELIDVLKK